MCLGEYPSVVPQASSYYNTLPLGTDLDLNHDPAFTGCETLDN